MSTILDNRPTTLALEGAVEAVLVRRTTLTRVIGSEWIKLRTLRSTWAGLASFVVVFVGLGAIAAAVATGSVSTPEGGGPTVGADPLTIAMTGAQFGVLLIGVLGALAGAREYGSGMITATLTAVPRRWQVVLAKTTTLTGLVLPAAVVASFAAYGVAMSILSSGDAATVSLTGDGVLLSVIGMAGYQTAIALIGLALGVLMRSVASSVSTLVGGVLVLPAIAGGLLPDSWDTALMYLPTQAAAAFTAVGGATGDTLSSGSGALVLAAWVATALAGALVSITRRDA